MLKARRLSSQKLYNTYLARWHTFCLKHNCDALQASVSQGLQFLQLLYDTGLGYSAINTARSALSSIISLKDGGAFGTHPDVKLFLKGIFNLRPTRSKYITTWDPEVVLRLLETWAPATDITLEKLSMKCIMLILLTSGQRPQILTKMSILHMKKTNHSLEFFLTSLDIKQGRPNFKAPTLLLAEFPQNKKLCVYYYMIIYLQRTALLRKDVTSVFLTTTKPHRAVSSNTLSRWLKSTLNIAGIDTTIFSPGSTRSASVSKAREQGAPLEQILQAGGWTRKSTFTTFYSKPIMPPTFASRVLETQSLP
jgi:hypothetical protein